MQGDRLAGGLWCHEVLEMLSDYVDGELEIVNRERVEAHLQECDVCERFGGDFANVVKSIRQILHTPPTLSRDLQGKLEKAILEFD